MTISKQQLAQQKWRMTFKALAAAEQREWLRDVYIEHAYYAEMDDLPALPVAFDTEQEEGCRADARRHKKLVAGERGAFERHMRRVGVDPVPEAWKLWLSRVDDATCRICGKKRSGKFFCKLHAKYE